MHYLFNLFSINFLSDNFNFILTYSIKVTGNNDNQAYQNHKSKTILITCNYVVEKIILYPVFKKIICKRINNYYIEISTVF